MIRTIFIFFCVGLSVIILSPIGLAGIIIGLFGLIKPMTVLIYRVAQGWARSMMALVGCKITVIGKENIPGKSAGKNNSGVCFVSNHGSIFDILLLLGYTGRPFGFIAKKELLFLPFLNIWIAVLGGLFINRKNPRKALGTINTGINRLKKGGCMVIFPEGTRSRGQGLLPFHPGSLKLATQSNAIIIPVALKGTYDIYEKNKRAKSGPVTITFCKPIYTADIPATDRKQVLADKIRDTIGEALEK